jgi:hypothetical protein
MVMIGIDPHKRTRTAVAIDGDEQVLGERLVRATAKQVPELVEWALRLDGGDRVWVIESAGGLGHLLAQQFLAAGETVVDIPASLGSRVRLLDGTVRQQRPQRRPIGGDRGAASTPTRAGAGRGPRVGVGAAGAAPHPASLDLQTRPHADCTPGPPSSCRAGSAKKSLSVRRDRSSSSTNRLVPLPRTSSPGDRPPRRTRPARHATQGTTQTDQPCRRRFGYDSGRHLRDRRRDRRGHRRPGRRHRPVPHR